MLDKDEPPSIEVRVKQRSERYAWELHRSGSMETWKCSVFIYDSEDAAKRAGWRALSIILARIERKTKRTKKAGRDHTSSDLQAQSVPAEA
jgi:hypothetical protein